MGPAIGQSLPVAVGVMISPLPIVAVVLMLTSRSARANAFSFVIAWFLCIGVVATILSLLLGAATDDAGGTPTWVGVAKIVLGALLLLVGVRQWGKRPRPGVEPETPAWMRAVDTFTPAKAAGLAGLLGVVNPKNLLLVVSGAAAIASSAGDDSTAKVVASIVFALVASIGVAAPVVVYLSAGDKAAATLDELKTWLIQHNAVIMMILLVIIGTKMIGDGITVL